MPRLKSRGPEWGSTFGHAGETPAEFFAQNPYFHVSEFLRHRRARAAARALRYHVSQGNLFNVRRGTYIWKSLAKRPDPFLLGTRLVAYAVVGYASALWWHKRLPAQKSVFMISRYRLADYEFAGITYRTVKPPLPLQGHEIIHSGGVQQVNLRGLVVDVCTAERAFVDCLDRLDVSPDLDTLWEIFCSEPLDAEGMIQHALALGNRVTIARLGLFISCYPFRWLQPPRVRDLRDRMPRTAALMDPSHHPARDCIFWPAWNLLVPSRLFHRLERGD